MTRNAHAIPRLQRVLDVVESLPPTQQILLVELVRKRASLRRRAGIARAAADALKAHRQGRVRRGSAVDLMRDLTR
jgi:hypothetical protein